MLIADIIAYMKEENIDFTFCGDKNVVIKNFSTPLNVSDNTILWIKDWSKINSCNLKGRKNLLLVSDAKQGTLNHANVILTNHSKAVFFTILDKFFSADKQTGSGKNTVILTKKMGENLVVGNNTYIGKDVVIGDNIIIGNNVSLENKVVIGDNTVIHSGTVIGTDGFGFFKDENGNNKRVPHYGGVILGKNVEIGANVTINRGTLDDTFIGDYTKIGANQLVPHNVVISENCLVLGQIGGSCHIGANSYIAPYSFIKNQVTVGKNCMVNMGTIVRDNVEDGYIVSGKRKIKMDYRLILNL